MSNSNYRRAVPKDKVVLAKKKQKNPKITPQKVVATGRTVYREIYAVVVLLLSLFAIISLGLISYKTLAPNTRFNNSIVGPIGVSFATTLFSLFGFSSFLLPIWGLYWAVQMFEKRDSLDYHPVNNSQIFQKILGVVGSILGMSVILSSLFGYLGGGGLGNSLDSSGYNLLGGFLFYTSAFVILVLSVGFVLGDTFSNALNKVSFWSFGSLATLFFTIPKFCITTSWKALNFVWLHTWGTLKNFYLFALDPFSSDLDEDENNTKQLKPIREIPKPKLRKNRIEEEIEIERDVPEEDKPILVTRRSDFSERKGSLFSKKQTKRSGEYEFPPLDFLSPALPPKNQPEDEELVTLSRLIEAKFKDFGVLGNVTEVHPGPVVTMYEFEPAAGVKVGRITALQDDLAMGIKATAVRIIAPLPKKGTVGIEVPNKHRDIVRLRELLQSPAFTNPESGLADSILSVPLGKDTYGDAVVVDIATMPHLLIAGATGTGKSVGINALLLSLLYRANPEELGLILIDPKILELSVYDGIPHLKVPVVTVPKQAKAVLNWAVQEMDKRYRLMQKYGVRNIDGYNLLVKGELSKLAELEKKQKQNSFDDELNPISESADLDDSNNDDNDSNDQDSSQDEVVSKPLGKEMETLPKIVIVIDELADLMLTVGKEIEELITRLAQKARAAGIHLILATQRPSVDVITGLIKANFPARVSFRVTSRIDSRTILDSMGAERLLGKGDMLFMLPGANSLKRLHGAFVSDEEVINVVKFIKEKNPPQYDEKILAVCQKALEEEDGGGSGEYGSARNGEDYDEFYDKAVEIVVAKGQASTSMIQRTFRIGYNRAARIIEMMEKEGVVGPMDGIKPREVLVQGVGENQV